MSARKSRRPRSHGRPDAGVRSSRATAVPIVAFLLAGLVLTLLAYYPAWFGGQLWDDDAHITRPALQSLSGLWRIWFEIGATQQYYPVVHSAFWLFHRLWGGDTLGYHLVNITLHATSAWLFALILRRLQVPGAWLAALIFAVHPIEVESVAWITELKNTLSGVFYLSAALAYLRFDADRERRWYGVAMGLFVLALLCKSVTATLPAALLVVFWWQRGRLEWRRDVQPVLPFFAAGAAAGFVTAWVERTQIGAVGSTFAFSPIERLLIAGRAVVFYLGKILWPHPLLFVYPRWDVSQQVWWQFLYPLGVVALVAAAWMWRARSRAPLAALLLFIGTLFPALGFVNVYPFVFSFVADHFQYLAGLSLFALAGAGLTSIAQRLGQERSRVALAAVVLVVVTPLAALTWQQSRQYVDSETLYRATLVGNPGSPMVRNNLGELLLERARSANPGTPILEEAKAQFEEALRLKPDLFPQAHNNLGTALMGLGRFAEAEAEYREALRLRPGDAAIRRNVSLAVEQQGHAFQARGRPDGAIAAYEEALRVSPDDVDAHGFLADALAGQQAFAAAIAHYRVVVNARPSDANAWTGLGVALISSGQRAEAVDAFRRAASADAGNSHFRQNLARALLEQGALDEAAGQAQQSVSLAPDDPGAHEVFGRVLAAQRKFSDARKEFERALQLDPSYAPAIDGLRALPRGGGGPDLES